MHLTHLILIIITIHYWKKSFRRRFFGTFKNSFEANVMEDFNFPRRFLKNCLRKTIISKIVFRQIIVLKCIVLKK